MFKEKAFPIEQCWPIWSHKRRLSFQIYFLYLNRSFIRYGINTHCLKNSALDLCWSLCVFQIGFKETTTNPFHVFVMPIGLRPLIPFAFKLSSIKLNFSIVLTGTDPLVIISNTGPFGFWAIWQSNNDHKSYILQQRWSFSVFQHTFVKILINRLIYCFEYISI